jgi:hypothetical protein
MSTFKDISEDNVRVSVSELNQVIDVIGDFISGTSNNSIQKFNQLGTSGTFQTVYDQNITSITANKVLDITYGQASNSKLTGSNSVDLDVKQDIYRQFAQNLLGSADSKFNLPFLSSSVDSEIKEAVFICFKRLFHRDKILQNTTTLNMNFLSASSTTTPATAQNYSITDLNFGNPNISPIQSEVTTLFSGTAGTTTPVGLAFLEQGIYVLDVSRSFDGSQEVTLNSNFDDFLSGPSTGPAAQTSVLSGSSIDQIIDHIRTTRFLSGTTGNAFNIAIEFQNVTRVNSSIFACDIGFEDFNISSNPTFVNSSTQQIRTLQSNGSGINNPTTFITSVGLHDAAGNLLAVAKPSRPIRNDRESRFIISVRLDY